MQPRLDRERLATESTLARLTSAEVDAMQVPLSRTRPLPSSHIAKIP